MSQRTILAAVIAVASLLGTFQVSGSRYWTPGLWAAASEASSPASGQAMTDDFQCLFAERRTVQIRGVEDNFSSAGKEPSKRPGWMVEEASPVSHLRAKDYDQVEDDAYLVDHFDLDRDVVSGLFVISVRSAPGDLTDTLYLGNMEDTAKPFERRIWPVFHQRLAVLETLPGWSRRDSIVSAPLSAIMMEGHPLSGGGRRESLLALIPTLPRQAGLDVLVRDDSTVDFMALVTCSRPASHGGYSMSVRDARPAGSRNILILSAEWDEVSGKSGNPFVGDTDCGEALPLMCFRDDGSPAPITLNALGSSASHLIEHWSGGTLRATEPVRGREFATIAEADRRCADRFGKGWRVADHHLGGQGFTFAGHGTTDLDRRRVWVDIKDQPYGTCWARGESRP